MQGTFRLRVDNRLTRLRFCVCAFVCIWQDFQTGAWPESGIDCACVWQGDKQDLQGQAHYLQRRQELEVYMPVISYLLNPRPFLNLLH